MFFLHSDGYYYMVATVPEYDRIELRRARTIGGLAEAKAQAVWRKHDKGIMGAHIWAPEIHFIEGKWYIYFTAGEAENIWAISSLCALQFLTEPALWKMDRRR